MCRQNQKQLDQVCTNDFGDQSALRMEEEGLIIRGDLKFAITMTVEHINGHLGGRVVWVVLSEFLYLGLWMEKSFSSASHKLSSDRWFLFSCWFLFLEE